MPIPSITGIGNPPVIGQPQYHSVNVKISLEDLRHILVCCRFTDHNTGKSPHTSKYVPWKLVTYSAFSDEQKAETFKCDLKSGSGHAFAKKRLW